MDQDPYKYFRIEARDLLDGMNQGVLDLEKGDAAREAASRLLRLVHTLKGAARVVKLTDMAQVAHAVEDVLAPYRDSDATVPRERIHDVLGLLETLRGHLKAIEPQPEVPSRVAVEEPIRTVRIDIDDIGRVLDGIAEAGVAMDALRREVARLGETAELARMLGGALAQAVEQAGRELDRVRDTTRQLRLVPASAVFPALERAARDAAESLGKRIRFETAGGDVHIDGHVLAALRDALLHLVRNAVAHGIEPEAQRAAGGKNPIGLVEVRVERRERRAAFICRDDGRGLDLEAIRQAAVRRNLVPADQAAALGLEEATRLVFLGGISTTRTVTEISGRGIGLEVVRDITARLKGDLDASTVGGRGTTVEIRVPVSLASVTTLLVEAGGATASVPMDSIVGALRVVPDVLAHSTEGDRLLFRDEALPLLPLSAILHQSPPPASVRGQPAVIVAANGRRAAIGVDRILGTTTVVMKQLPRSIDRIPAIAGASFDAEGNPLPVLDPAGLVAAVLTGGRSAPPPAPPVRPSLLVIDDSLTTRMLEQGILEAAGYDVDAVASGEEALERARERRYALFIVDIEMPGMDGFEFIRRAVEDPALRGTPSILVTSRSSAEDRRRGEQVGARAYIVKSEFDEAGFLRRIHDLIT